MLGRWSGQHCTAKAFRLNCKSRILEQASVLYFLETTLKVEGEEEMGGMRNCQEAGVKSDSLTFFQHCHSFNEVFSSFVNLSYLSLIVESRTVILNALACHERIICLF